MEHSTTVMLIGTHAIGLVGVQEIFEELYAAGKPPDSATAEILIQQTNRENYIPPGSRIDYGEALLREYESFCQRRESGCVEERRSLSSKHWMGIPREQIPWYPTVDLDRCTGCRDCLTFCPNDVYAWDAQREKVIVQAPFQCEVACSSCAELCKTRAITFPPPSLPRTIQEQRQRR